MAFQNDESGQQDPSALDGDAGADGTGGGGADDLSGVLGGGGDPGFITGDAKKPLGTGTVIMAGFLLACGVGTYVMYTRSAPASSKPSAEAAAAQTTITQFLSDDKQNVDKMKDLLQNTEKAVEQFRASPGKQQVPIEDLRTNPFRLTADEPAGDEPEDTHSLAARKREEAARAATLKAAQSLKLEFIMAGGKRKSCMINKAVYREGQPVGEFVIESIATDAVVISKGDARFELRMKR